MNLWTRLAAVGLVAVSVPALMHVRETERRRALRAEAKGNLSGIFTAMKSFQGDY